MEKSLVFILLDAAISNGREAVITLRNNESIKRICVNLLGDWDFVCSLTKVPELTIGTFSGNRYCIERDFKSYDNIVSIEIL